MGCFSSWCKLCLLFVFLYTSLCAQHLREKGTKTSILCYFTKYEQDTIWQVQAENDYINLTSCNFASNTCVDTMPHEFNGEVRKSTYGGFIVYLFINSVRTNETVFRCHGKYSYTTQSLEVYARPRNPTCNPVGLDYTKKTLEFKCQARHVYPSLSAILYIKGVDVYQQGIFSPHCTNDLLDSNGLDGYTAECEWRVSAAEMEPMKHSYYVTVFPNLSNSTGKDIPYVFSQVYTLQLSSPIAAIDYAHCPVGTDVEDKTTITGSTASCRCILEKPGFPVGQARWYTEHGNQSLGRDDPINGSSTLEVYANMSGQRYQCRAESSLRNPLNWGPVFTPVFKAPRPSHSESETGSQLFIFFLGVFCTVVVYLILSSMPRLIRHTRQCLDTTRVADSSASTVDTSV